MSPAWEASQSLATQKQHSEKEKLVQRFGGFPLSLLAVPPHDTLVYARLKALAPVQSLGDWLLSLLLNDLATAVLLLYDLATAVGYLVIWLRPSWLHNDLATAPVT